MNQFTKKELETIIEALDKLYFGEFYSKKEFPELYEKVQTMLENYCEHEFVGYIEGSAAVPYCNKCQRAIL